MCKISCISTKYGCELCRQKSIINNNAKYFTYNCCKGCY